MRSSCCSELVAIPSVSGEEAARGRVRRGDRARLGARRGAGRHRGPGRGAGPARRGRRSRWSPTSTSCRRARAGPAIRSRPIVEGTRLYGRGSGDAKASVAAMLSAAQGPGRRRRARRAAGCWCILGYGEETKNTTMERAVERAGADRRRGGRRAHQSRHRHRAARAHDGGPASPGATSATPATPPPTASSPTPRWCSRATCSSSTASSPAASHPVLGRTTATPTMLEAGREPERHAAGRQGGARHPQHARLDPRGDRRACCGSALDVRGRGHLAAAGALRDAGRLAPARRRAAGAAGGRARSAARPAPTGCSSATPTRSSAGPAPAGARTRRTSTWTCPRSPRRAASTRGWRAPTWRGALSAMAGRRRSGAPARRPRSARCWNYTAGDDRAWDARLLRWDVLGSLGHIEGLRAVAAAQRRASTPGCARGLRAALAAVDARPARARPGARGRAHGGRGLAHPPAARASASGSTPAARATTRSPATSGSILKDRLLALHAGALDLAAALLAFAARHRAVLWPGYTHQRRAMPSSVGLWAGALRRGTARYRRVAAGALAPGRPLAARQRGGLRRAAAAPARGGRARARLRRARPQRRHGAGRAGQARGRGALLVHPARPRARAGCRRT